MNASIRLIIVFSVAFSLLTLASPLSSNFRLPSINPAHANIQQCQTHGVTGSCSEFWYPAGPEMNTETATIFSDSTAELTNLQSPSPSIDFSDAPCSPSLCSGFASSPNFLLTSAVPEAGYYEIQFMLANNFWGCNFSFGNSACGVQVRQAFAHMMDKTVYANTEANIAGFGTAIDNPVPASSAGAPPAPNPCSYDSSFPQSGTNCVVGSAGGTAYHLASATGANGFQWLYSPGSADLNAAAQHFVNAGIATGFNSGASVLIGISPVASANPIMFFIRNDDPSRLDLGNSLEQQVCYLFTGAYTVPCPYVSQTSGPVTAFPGFTTSTTSVNLNWWVYTAAYSYVPFFDRGLYFNYNSRFVSGIPSIEPPGGTCSSSAVPTQSASNYMYACNSNFDSLSSQVETAPCITAPGDPVNGATSNLPTPPGNGICPGSTQLSATSAGIQAEASFGANVLTLPIFQRTLEFPYLNNGWIRAINNADVGLPNYFTWLNTRNPSPVVPGTIRQGFSQSARSVSPFIASTLQERYLVGSVYDSLYQPDPLAPAQMISTLVTSEYQFPGNNLGYTPPTGTQNTFRFSLTPGMFFQDGRQITVFDVAFSYLSMIESGAYLGGGAASITGITILSRGQFDINVNSLGGLVLPSLATVPIVPARYWTSAGSSAWDAAMTSIYNGNKCQDSMLTTSICFPTQFTLNFSAGTTPTVSVCTVSCVFPPIISSAAMTINPADLTAAFDPILNHTFVGSGPWTCGTVTASGSGQCTPTGTMNPGIGSSYTLTRFGVGFAPASSLTSIYSRSSGNLALWIWASNGITGPTIFTVAQVAACFGQPVVLTGPCAHWQQGIGNPGPAPVTVNQVAVVLRFFYVNWVAPFNWGTNPPPGIGAAPPVLYEGSATLNPASVAGCSVPYPTGGYDC